MPLTCSVSQKVNRKGHNVSHSNNRTARDFRVNFQNFSFYAPTLGRKIRLKLSVKGANIIGKFGGLEEYLLAVKASRLGKEMQVLKQELMKKIEKRVTTTQDLSYGEVQSALKKAWRDAFLASAA